MINFKDQKDQIPSAAAVLGMILLAGSVVGLFTLPKVDKKKITEKALIDGGKALALKKSAEENVYNADLVNDRFLWTNNTAEITPAALAKISNLLEDTKLSLVSFRPQKGIEGASLLQIQYNLAVEGPYTSVATLVDRIERSDSKLAVNSVQYAATEGETSLVTANIGLVAFHEIEKKTPASKTMTTQPMKTRGATSRG